MSTTIKIKGMSCNHCATAVTKALATVAGITNVKVDLGGGTATYDATAAVDSALVQAAVAKAGYEVIQ